MNGFTFSGISFHWFSDASSGLYEPSVEALKNQVVLETVSPPLTASKMILTSIVWALSPYRRHREITLALAQRAVKVTIQISVLLATTQEVTQLRENLENFEQTLRNIHTFVQFKSQYSAAFRLFHGEEVACQYLALDRHLTSLLEDFKDWARNVAAADVFSEYRNGSVVTRSGIFPYANGVNVYGGTFQSVAGDFLHIQQTGSQVSNSIIPNLRVVSTEDISTERQLLKRQTYRLYSGRISGKAVAIKLYEGCHARKLGLEAAKLNQMLMHPSILHMIGGCSSDSSITYLVFEGDYEGAVESIITVALKKELRQSLILGVETVIGLSSGLEYLQGLDYPFECAELEHFVVLRDRNGKISISFDPLDISEEDMEEGQKNPGSIVSDKFVRLSEIFHGLCEKTFDAARQAHYQARPLAYEYSDFPDEGQTRMGEYSMEDLDYGLQSRNSDVSTSRCMGTENLGSQSHRRELVWNSQQKQAVSLPAISCEFQRYLNDLKSSSHSALNHRHGRYNKPIAHRCPGYSRVEITLTTATTQTAIISHSIPTAFEICPICEEVVIDDEILNCTCGQDEESMYTIRCPGCGEWRHRHCMVSGVQWPNLCKSCSGTSRRPVSKRKKRKSPVAEGKWKRLLTLSARLFLASDGVYIER